MTRTQPWRQASGFPEGVRPSLRARRVAEILDADITTIYRLVKSGQLEAFRVGSDYRVFLDSLADFQAGTRVQPVQSRRDAPVQRQPPTAAHRESVDFLRRMGVSVFPVRS